MKIDQPNWIDAGLLLGLLALTLLAIFPEWELALAARFHDPVTGWPLDALFWVQAVYHWATLPALLLAITGLLVGMGAWRWAALRRYRTVGWFLFTSMVVGPGLLVNSVFKEHFERPRPRQLMEFGGEAQFRQIGEPGITERGRSFPSGHASMGFFLAAPYFFLRRRHQRLAIGCLLLGTAAGLGIGLVRMMQGGHFLGDVIAAGLMVWIVCRATWGLLNRPVSAPPPVTAAAPELLIQPPGRLRCPDRVAWVSDLNKASQPTVSVIVPFYNEEAVVKATLEELRQVQPDVEVIAVDDGSTDETWRCIQAVPGVIGVSHERNQGQSAAIISGLRHANGEFCVLMDGDGQNNPADISLLLQTWALGQADVICGYRQNRRDTWSRVIASRLANGIRRLFLHDGVRDTGCSLKLFHRSAIDLLPPFNGLHRYLPALFLKAGLTLEEIPVDHRFRTAGVSKYTNWRRGLVGIQDLIGVSWLLRRHVIITPPRVSTHERSPV